MTTRLPFTDRLGHFIPERDAERQQAAEHDFAIAQALSEAASVLRLRAINRLDYHPPEHYPTGLPKPALGVPELVARAEEWRANHGGVLPPPPPMPPPPTQATVAKMAETAVREQGDQPIGLLVQGLVDYLTLRGMQPDLMAAPIAAGLARANVRRRAA